jgi:AcrR family transcriptional regulator
VREWIPISTSPKGRLALAALKQFGERPFDDVTVGELAAAADVTTGALYHHFGSKLGLYDFVRDDVERRLLDRMEGAIAASASLDRSAAVMAALVIGFDFAVREGFLRILGDPPAGTELDRLADLLSASTASASRVLGRVLAAAWRAALVAVAEGSDPQQARAALLALEFRLSS